MPLQANIIVVKRAYFLLPLNCRPDGGIGLASDGAWFTCGGACGGAEPPPLQPVQANMRPTPSATPTNSSGVNLRIGRISSVATRSLCCLRKSQSAHTAFVVIRKLAQGQWLHWDQHSSLAKTNCYLASHIDGYQRYQI